MRDRAHARHGEISIRGDLAARLKMRADEQQVTQVAIVEAALGDPETWPAVLAALRARNP